MTDIYSMMNYNKLGKSSLSISQIAFGCMSLTGTETEKIRLLHHAIDTGINFFDTADLYDKGQNEETVGTALKNRRDKLIVATKVGNQWNADGSAWSWNPGKEYILQAVEKSLQRLQTDYIDLYQLHGGTIQDPIEETIEAFELLKAQGKIRYYGISSIRPNVIREYVRKSSVSSVMMQYSLLDRRPEEACFPLLKENNIGIIVRGSLAQGLLVNKPAREYLGRTVSEVQNAAAAIASLSTNNRKATQTAILFALQHPEVTSAVIGIKNEKQLEEAVKAATAPVLSEKEMEMLMKMAPANYYTDHR